MVLWTAGVSAGDTQVAQEKRTETTEPAGWNNGIKNVGIDLGYGFVKLMNKNEEIMFPSVVGLGKELQFHSFLGNHHSPLDNLVIGVDGKQYFVGDLAIRQSDFASRSLDQNRINDQNAKVLLLTSLVLLSQWENENFNLVTGLPTNYFSAYHLEWGQALKRRYEVTFGANGSTTTKKFSVKNVRIVPQPFGTLYDQMLNSFGKVINREMARLMVGIVDIGFKTTDFAVANQLEFIEHLSASTTTALSTAYRLIANRLRQDFKIDKELHELDKIIQKGIVRIAGNSHDITEIRDEIYERVAMKIITELASLWDYRDFDVILLTGGGGQVLAPYLLPHFTNAMLVDKAQHANVRGFHKLAHQIFSSDQD